VAVLGQPRDNLGADEPGAADDYSFRHAEPSTCSLIGSGLMLGDVSGSIAAGDVTMSFTEKQPRRPS
jgi:hypothetical protein